MVLVRCILGSLQEQCGWAGVGATPRPPSNALPRPSDRVFCLPCAAAAVYQDIELTSADPRVCQVVDFGKK